MPCRASYPKDNATKHRAGNLDRCYEHEEVASRINIRHHTIAERGRERDEDHLVRKHQHRSRPILRRDDEKHCELLIRLSDRCEFCD
jgi:hypothetical protein